MCLPLPLQGENGKCPSSSTVQNITTLKVPSFDHAPYRAGSEHAKLAVCVGMRGAGGWVAGWVGGRSPGLAITMRAVLCVRSAARRM